jgi:hypothetical protein
METEDCHRVSPRSVVEARGKLSRVCIVQDGLDPEVPPGLDKFAEVYVPLWLRSVNEAQPALVVPRSPAESVWVGVDLSLLSRVVS